MQNSDAVVLLSKKVSLDASMPLPHEQALRIAVYDEYRAFEAYKSIIEKFGDKAPFANIMQSEIRHYEMLIGLCEKYGVEPPVNDIQITAPDTLGQCYELGVAAEIENIQMYDSLIPYVKEYPDILDAFYKAQASSFNNHLPTFRAHVEDGFSKSNINNFNPEEMMDKVNEFSALAQKIASGEANPDEISKIFGNLNISLISGILTGGVGGVALNEFFKNKEED